MTVKVGCCGYRVSKSRYQEAFQLVELNSTFYRYPRISTVEKWRKESPWDFEFTVKTNQEISHKHKLKKDLVFKAFDRMKKICEVLHAYVMLMQTPRSFTPDLLRDAYAFFKCVDRGGLSLVWETRGDQWEKSEVRNELRRILKDVDVPHVTDPFRIMPTYVGRVAYFRLHGHGKRMYYYQYTDVELEKLHSQVELLSNSGLEVYVLFNNLSMFEDARRFLHYLKLGEFPSITGSVGMESIGETIKRTRYPLTKSELIKKLGWRVVELDDSEQIRLEELLIELPSKRYENAEEVISDIKLGGIS